MGHSDGGHLVSVLAFYSVNPSLIMLESTVLFCIIVKNEKEAGDWTHSYRVVQI